MSGKQIFGYAICVLFEIIIIESVNNTRCVLNSESTQLSLFQCDIGIGLPFPFLIPLLCLFPYQTRLAKLARFCFN